jgi:3',5'-cyclic AMP phosphodiesterase CpdA
MKVIHASDLHFGNSARVFEHTLLLRGFEQLCAQAADDEIVFVVSGDIGFKGRSSAYGGARKWFQEIIARGLVRRENIVICPGNHDICDGSFDAFDAFSFGVRQDAACTYGLNRDDARLLAICGTTFLVMNSAHHVDHRYGLAPLSAAAKALESRRAEVSAADCRVAVLHHHLIPAQQHDTSTARNAYGLLSLLDAWNFDLVLHGHLHAFDYLPIGRSRMSTFGVTSLNFPAPGASNGMLLYDPYAGWISRHALFRDLIAADGSAGTLQRIDTIKTGTTT